VQASGAEQMKNFFGWVSGKTPQAQQPVANFVPLGVFSSLPILPAGRHAGLHACLGMRAAGADETRGTTDIRHIGSGVELLNAADAAAACRAKPAPPPAPRDAPDPLQQPAQPPPPPPPPPLVPLPEMGEGCAPPHQLSPSRGTDAPPRPPPPPPPPPPPVEYQHASAGGQWACVACTLLNDGSDGVCAACGAARGGGGARDADAVMDEQRRQLVRHACVGCVRPLLSCPLPYRLPYCLPHACFLFPCPSP
jgi:hypothetical protein